MSKLTHKQEFNDAKVIVNSANSVTDGKVYNASLLKAENTFLLGVKEAAKRKKNKKIFESDGVTVMTRKDGSLVIHVSVTKQNPEGMKSYYSERKRTFSTALEVAMLTHKTIQIDEI